MDAHILLEKLRDGTEPSQAELTWFSNGLATGAVTDAQAGAFAMAVLLKGLSDEGRVALTLAMRDSGDVLKWSLGSPVVDKHSTGGIGDSVSLLLAPLLAAVGVPVPMISGRGLGHTGGTLDKLETIPGVRTDVTEGQFRTLIDEVGCAIVSANANIAPADRRLYAVRDVTATVPSVDLITASILSKKLAAGLDALVLDVKYGSGAFMKSPEEAQNLAEVLVQTANDAGCKTSALITDMSQPLVAAAGNAVELAEVMRALTTPEDTRLINLTFALGAEMMVLAGFETAPEVATVKLREALFDGKAAVKFDAMIAGLGGPEGFSSDWRQKLPEANVIREITADKSGKIASINGQLIGRGVVHLGGGRLREKDKIDHSVGYSDILPLGSEVSKGAPIARLHAATEKAALLAERAFLSAISISDEAAILPLVLGKVG